MSDYGKDWPGRMKDQQRKYEMEEDGQFKLPIDTVERLKELMIAGGNPSFDINESPATRRIRGIRKLKERGIGGEAGNASDILKRSIQLPNLQADASSQLREHLKPGTKGLRPYDKSGGGRGIPVDKWLELIRSAPHQAHVDQYLNSLMKIQNREFDDQRSLQYLNSLMKKNRELDDQRSL